MPIEVEGVGFLADCSRGTERGSTTIVVGVATMHGLTASRGVYTAFTNITLLRAVSPFFDVGVTGQGSFI